MHEQSETEQTPLGRWQNVYGKKTRHAGKPLAPTFAFERKDYPDQASAVNAAQGRSQLQPPHSPLENILQFLMQYLPMRGQDPGSP